MYERIVVATDTTRPATAVTIASALADDVGALELVTITPPGVPLGVGRVELERLAAQHGWLPAACAVLAGRDVATTLLDHVARRRGALLVIGSRAPHPLTATGDAGQVTRRLVANSPDPILVVGPHVDNRFHPQPGRLIVAVDGPDPAEATLDAVDNWVRTFCSARSWVIEVAATADSTDADRDVMRWVHALKARGLPASHAVVYDGGAAAGIDRFSAAVRNAVLVATSRRYRDGHRHLHSTTRDLIHRGRHPVLVVPDRPPPGSHVQGLAASGPLALST